jgi:amino acid transporter
MTAGPLDFKAQADIQALSESRATNARTRAEKWVAGLTSLTGVLTTVLVLKGPESVTELSPDTRAAVAWAFAAALASLIGGIFFAYSAAFGNVFDLSKLRVEDVDGLHARLQIQRAKAEKEANRWLRYAIILTVLGVVCVAAGVRLSWFDVPAGAGETDQAICISTEDGGIVARVPGDSISVTELGTGFRVEACGN